VDAKTRFKRAVEGRDAKALRHVLEESAEARAAIDDTIFGFDGTALLSVGNHLAMVEVLLEFGADPNKKSAWWAGGFHPLYSARGAVAERLIAAGAVPDACALAHLDRAEDLARMLAAEPERVHERGGDGQTPLHFAASRRIVDLLLDAGADIDARDVDHRSTAAEWMIGGELSGPRPELARYLVERGARADIFLCAALGLADRVEALLAADPSLLKLRTSQGDYAEKPPSSYHIYQWTIEGNYTPMQAAAKFGHDNVLAVMERFATLEQRLLLACTRGDAGAARAIVAANPGIVEGLELADQRALTDAAWAANGPAVEIMMELGFDPSIPSVTGATGGNALHCAAWEGSVACMAALLNHERGRALVNSVERTYGGTPLSWCCHGSRNCGNPNANHAEVARLLIGAGAKVTAEMAEWECARGMQPVIEAAVGAKATRTP
jgi:ankyrin repeat protein